MANIRVDLDHPIIDGETITFKAPCDCTAIEGLIVYYPTLTENSTANTSKVFTFKDAHGNELTGIGNLFTAGSYVKAVVDTTNDYAYLQNADTNGYIEQALRMNAKIAHGSYVGAGAHGEANPNRLTFDFVPKLVIVRQVDNYNYGAIMVNGATSITTRFAGSIENEIITTWMDKTVSWYDRTGSAATNAAQLNSAGKTYYYVAIG